MAAITLTQGFFARVSKQDYSRVSRFKWCVAKRRNTRYAVSRQAGEGKIVYLHSFILGEGPGEVAHRNGDGLDCRRGNLRRGTHQENLLGPQKKREGTYSQFRGVSWDPRRSKWYAKSGRLGKQFFLGYHDSEIAASRAFQKWSRKYLKQLCVK